ncbi:MAG: TrbG/VirB9 family P-type conjugative transfer protein, partial [Steroidobacteraceae bacterium]
MNGKENAGGWMGRAFALAAVSLTLALVARAEVLPERGTGDPRIRTAAYSPDEVYRLYGFVGYHLDLEFEADETFASISGGDLEGLTYSAHGNVLTLKPKVASTEMNLSVTT